MCIVYYYYSTNYHLMNFNPLQGGWGIDIHKEDFGGRDKEYKGFEG